MQDVPAVRTGVDTSIETTMKANLINKRKRDEQVVNY